MKKIIIYSICKNEEDFVDTWYESAKQADEIYVLDTGSTDKTVEKFKKYPKVKLFEKHYEHFSFSDAWNTILSKIPYDDCIVFRLDLDQYIINKYWYFELQLCLNFNMFNYNKYNYVLNFNMYEKNFNRMETRNFCASKKDFAWTGYVHEYEYFNNDKPTVLYFVPVTIYHNQKFASSNCNIKGCVEKHNYYVELAEHQFEEHKTVPNFFINAIQPPSEHLIEVFEKYMKDNNFIEDKTFNKTYHVIYDGQTMNCLYLLYLSYKLLNISKIIDFKNFNMDMRYPYFYDVSKNLCVNSDIDKKLKLSDEIIKFINLIKENLQTTIDNINHKEHV